MTWDDIYYAAMNKGINDPELKAKDTAREQVRCLAISLGADDLNKADCPEEKIEDYCDMMRLKFDEKGNIIDITLPRWVETYVYRKKEHEYIEQDIREMIDNEDVSVGDITSDSLTETQINEIIETYHHYTDCNVSYNDTLANAIENVLN
jgi:hypothetical protein